MKAGGGSILFDWLATVRVTLDLPVGWVAGCVVGGIVSYIVTSVPFTVVSIC